MIGKRLIEIIQENHLEDYEIYLWVYGSNKLRVILSDEKNKKATLAPWDDQEWETKNGEEVKINR